MQAICDLDQVEALESQLVTATFFLCTKIRKVPMLANHIWQDGYIYIYIHIKYTHYIYIHTYLYVYKCIC